jgi:O-methyltransferase
MTSPEDIDATMLFFGDPLVRLWRARGLNRLFNAAVPLAPRPVQRWIEDARAKTRENDLRAQIEQRSRLIPEPEFRGVIQRGLQTLVERCGQQGIGDYLEFGVYNGTSLTCVFRELQAVGLNHVRLFGFDSFQGLPPDAHLEDEGRWRPGSCCSSLDFTTAVLETEGVDLSRTTLVPGWFSDTLNARTAAQHAISKASVIMVDCDLYSSAKEALTFCAPLITDHALVIFDEWSPYRVEDKDVGERRAFNEFLEEWGCFNARPFGSYTRRAQSFLVSRC